MINRHFVEQGHSVLVDFYPFDINFSKCSKSYLLSMVIIIISSDFTLPLYFFIYFIQIIVIVKHILENTLGHKNSTQMRGIDGMILSFVRLAILLGLKNAANVESKNY